MERILRRWLALAACVACVVLAVSGVRHDAGAGSIDGTTLGTILPGAADTTSEIAMTYSNGAGFILTWTEEDSVTVTVQSSIDGGATWFRFNSVLIDGGTSGPFAVARAIQFSDFAAVGAAASGGFANLPIGTHARAIVTNSGSDTLSSVRLVFAQNY